MAMGSRELTDLSVFGRLNNMAAFCKELRRRARNATTEAERYQLSIAATDAEEQFNEAWAEMLSGVHELVGEK